MRGVGKFVVLVIVGVITAFTYSKIYPPPKTAAVADFCKKPGAASGYQSWVKAGIIKDQRGSVILVDEKPWEAIVHDGKVSLTAFAYCHIGAGYVSIEGWHDGQRKAHMIDGNYFD